jgi:hypothetical protein
MDESRYYSSTFLDYSDKAKMPNFLNNRVYKAFPNKWRSIIK